jgi:hypothetical protein
VERRANAICLARGSDVMERRNHFGLLTVEAWGEAALREP